MNNFERFRNGIQLSPDIAIDPTTGKFGEMYFNPTTKTVRVCVNESPTVWTDINLAPGIVNYGILVWDATNNTWVQNQDVIANGNSITTGVNKTLTFKAGDAAPLSDGNGSNVYITAGLGDGVGTKGDVVLDGLKISVAAQNATDPVSGNAGDFYYNTSTLGYKYFDGNAWRSMNSDGGFTKVNLHDPVSTTLPTGTGVIVDGVTVTDGMTVLFTNLSSGNNQVYRASDSLIDIIWTPVIMFTGSVNPNAGDNIIIIEGDSFADEVGEYNGANWKFHERIRQFNGQDYVETSAVYSSTITNNTTGPLFSITAFGTEYSIADYSIKRGTAREVGTLYIIHDGTNATVTGANGSLAFTGVTFSASISAGILTVSYIADNSGMDGVFKFSLKRWSDAAGGPGGLPSYTGAPPTAGAAAGGNGEVQFSDGMNLSASPNFKYNTTDNAIEIGGMQIIGVSAPITLNDVQPSPATIFSFPPVWEFVEIHYSIERGTNRRRGRLQVTNNGTASNCVDDYVELATMDIAFSSSVSSGVNIEYVASSQGAAPIFRYSVIRWQ